MLPNDSHQNMNEVSKGVDGILASLYRQILFSHGVNTAKFNRLMEFFIRKTNKQVSTKEATSIRGNLRKELLKGKMSWKVFLKGLYFLNIVKFDITIKLHEASGRISVHEKSIILSDEQILREEDD